MKSASDMRKTGRPNINTGRYWDMIYESPTKFAEHKAQENESYTSVGDVILPPTKRFKYALKEVKAGDKVLDMGCGLGSFLKLVKKEYPENEIWGTDISQYIIDLDKEDLPEAKLFCRRIGAQVDIPEHYFDIVFCGETIEHLDEPVEAFVDAYRFLKPGGKFIITTPKGNKIESEEHTWYFDREDVEGLYYSVGFTLLDFIYLPDMEHIFILMAVGTKE